MTDPSLGGREKEQKKVQLNNAGQTKNKQGKKNIPP